ncbi:hypothetical protein GALMADRAFT_221724 [Galerina marginata CBS 339.88]|uniref:Histone H1 n=1 Tax=Galerina marginata (strain CBS 339.88) TaxID=685588 RepID=A0A067TSB2_GALM3|nr:hypothetical protein GALMADRAFT_221724 [Galerina marginata CBS 339.88]
MQVPYSAHPHYHPYYQIHPPGPQDHDLKRRYLALLPPQQIIEICLAFDVHVSPYIRSTVWPLDFNVAIAGLQKTPQAPAKEEPPKDGEAVMNSLQSPPRIVSTPTVQDTARTTEPQPPDKERPPTPGPSTAPYTTANNESTTSLPQTSASSSSATTEPPRPELTTQSDSANQPEPSPTPQPAPDIQSASATESAPVTQTSPSTQTAPTAQPLTAQPNPTVQPPYPHQPYGYAHPQYPISSYYPQHPGSYAYPYGAYPAPMQSPYHPQPPIPYPQPTSYNHTHHPSHQQQQQQDGVSPDDLPSYEEMIVEALTGCTDPEGLAPKDLFTLMSSRYPLQSNFRPSASQALQKAYKRGRFEKSNNGKYRLNPTWEGGNTTRRTTRRPQTQPSQSTPTTNSTPAPPFTKAPLVHHNHPSTSSQPVTHPSQPYGYPGYAHYPGYPTAPQPSTTPGTEPAASTSTADKFTPPSTKVEVDSDAYVAAQNILNAINFGSMYQLAPEERQGGDEQFKEEQQADGDQPSGNGVEQLLSHVQAMLANNAANSAPDAGTTNLTPLPAPQAAPDGSVEDPRAELQAQLALLAAQLAELAQAEDAVPLLQVAPMPTPAAPVSSSQVHFALTPVVAAPINAPAPSVSSVPDALPEEEESDDDDMEEVI